MEKIELTPEELERAAIIWGLSEEEKKTRLPKLTPYQKRFVRHFPDFFRYKIVQEVTFAKTCATQGKPGDKIVYSAMGDILREECNFGARGRGFYCVLLPMSMLPMFYVVRDRICAGFDDPSPVGYNNIKCPDTDIDYNGTGLVFTKVYCIKSKVTPPPGIYRPEIYDLLK